jgi:EAL domain-containing protein (putative c-di-GMP-specific phosphodiesterase class I)
VFKGPVRQGQSARRLELEITETVLLQDTEAVMMMLHSLHHLGVRVSMDDFGTGYSSLNYLLRFPFDKIKIDRSFVSELRGSPDDAADATAASETLLASARNAAIIVRTIIGLGNNLGIATIACSRHIEMTPLCKIEVTLPRVLGSREVRRGGDVDEQAGVQPS